MCVFAEIRETTVKNTDRTSMNVKVQVHVKKFNTSYKLELESSNFVPKDFHCAALVQCPRGQTTMHLHLGEKDFPDMYSDIEVIYKQQFAK